MALRNQIEKIVLSLTDDPVFIYGTANELNTLADNEDFQSKAGVFMYAVQQIELSYALSGAIDEGYNIYLEFLKITEFGLFTSENEEIVNQCLALAKEFMIKIREFRTENGNKLFKVSLNDKAKSISVYDKFNVNMVGISLAMNIRLMYKDQFC